jgi:hypothetical protein
MTLEPCSSIDVRCDPNIGDMWEVSHDGESLAACFEVGDYFVVVAIDDVKDSVGFWVLMCTKKLHMVTKDKQIDAYGQMFIYNNQVVIGKYFEQQGRSMYSYVQCDIGEAYIYSHFIRVVKFQMI